MNENGCLFEVPAGNQYSYVNKRWEKVTNACRKLTAPNSVYCPHHKLITESEAEELSKKMTRVSHAKVFKKQREEDLKNSPLAAVNPNFDSKGGYSS